MLLITGLPQNPSIVAEVDISKLPDSVNPMAVSDDAGAVLFFVSEGSELGIDRGMRRIGIRRALEATLVSLGVFAIVVCSAIPPALR